MNGLHRQSGRPGVERQLDLADDTTRPESSTIVPYRMFFRTFALAIVKSTEVMIARAASLKARE
jgi:hypothetical protein